MFSKGKLSLVGLIVLAVVGSAQDTTYTGVSSTSCSIYLSFSTLSILENSL
jgi:hypothetical protein